MYQMCKRLLQLKDFCQEHAKDFKELCLSLLDWNAVENFCNALQPVAETCLRLQASDLLPSDFFASWVKLQFTLAKKSDKYSSDLLQAVTARGKIILESPPVLASVFLDARYQLLLNSVQK